MTAPRPRSVAPTATCAVATSAALLLQIVQAPRVSCSKTPISQAVESPRNGEIFSRCAETKNQITPIATSTAPKRCAICNQICVAETSDIAMVMAHGRAKRELQIDEYRRCQGDAAQ